MSYLKVSLGIFAALAASRFVPHPPNFTSLLALSFYVPALMGVKFLPALILSFVITDLSLNITPSSSSNKVLVHATCPVYAASGSHFIFTVYRNAINLGNTNWGCGASTNNEISSTSISILDTPNTTSATTYKLTARGWNSGAGNFHINRSDTDGDTVSYTRPISTITAMEIPQ